MIWFTSDQHFNCEGLVKITRKSFASVLEHDTALLNNINRVVGRRDTLFILGDFCKGDPAKYRQKIRCRNIFFALGNHDHKNKTIATFGENNVFVEKTISLTNKEKVVCCHYPMAFWDNCFRGRYHAYGHLHNDYKRESMMNLGMPGRRSMDIGVDHARMLFGDYRPISEVEFLDLLSGRKGHDLITPEEKW